MKGRSIDVRQLLLKGWILIGDAGMSERSPEQATAIATQLNHLRVLFPQAKRPSRDSEYGFPVFSGIVLSSGGYLLGREVVLGEFPPDSLFLRENG